MSTGSVFITNRTQAVQLPADTQFPDNVKKVAVRVIGLERVLSPLDSSWDSFFLLSDRVTDDFMPSRTTDVQSGRETF